MPDRCVMCTSFVQRVPALRGAALLPPRSFGSTARWLIQAENAWVHGYIVKRCLETRTVIYCPTHGIVSLIIRERDTERQ